MVYARLALVIAAMLTAVAWSRVRTGEYVSPLSIVAVAWGVSFGLFLLRLLPYVPITPRAGFILLLGVAGLLAGILAGERLTRRARPAWTSPRGARAWILPYAALGLCGIAWYLWLVDREVGWRMLFENARMIRIALVTYRIPSAFLFLEYFCIVAVLIAVALAATGERLKWWHWAAVTVCLVSTWLSTDRTQFYAVFLTSAFMLLYRHGPSLGLRRMSLVAGGVVVILALYFLAIGLWVGKTSDLLGTAAWFPERPAESADGGPRSPVLTALAAKAAGLYLYATGSYPAFSVWSATDRPRTWGVEAIYPIARALKKAGVLQGALPPALPEASIIARKDNAEISFNAYTFLYYPMHDFGVAGVAVYSLLVGCACGVAYGRMRRARHSPLHLLVAAQASTALALSIFVNKFSNTASWYVFVFTVAPFLLPIAAARLRRGMREQ